MAEIEKILKMEIPEICKNSNKMGIIRAWTKKSEDMACFRVELEGNLYKTLEKMDMLKAKKIFGDYKVVS